MLVTFVSHFSQPSFLLLSHPSALNKLPLFLTFSLCPFKKLFSCPNIYNTPLLWFEQCEPLCNSVTLTWITVRNELRGLCVTTCPYFVIQSDLTWPSLTWLFDGWSWAKRHPFPARFVSSFQKMEQLFFRWLKYVLKRIVVLAIDPARKKIVLQKQFKYCYTSFRRNKITYTHQSGWIFQLDPWK